MQIKTTVRYHLTLVGMAIIKKSINNKCRRGCGEKATLLYRWWECKLVHPLWKTVWRFLRKLKIELSYDTAIPLLGIYLDETVIQKDTCTPMFIAAPLTIAKTWKQPKCPPTDEWIKKMWHIYTMECYSAIKKERNTAICSNMDATRDYHTKWSKSERKTNTIWYHLCVESKIRRKWTYLQNRNRLIDIENRLVVAKRDGGEGEEWTGSLGLVDANYCI